MGIMTNHKWRTIGRALAKRLVTLRDRQGIEPDPLKAKVAEFERWGSSAYTPSAISLFISRHLAWPSQWA